MQEYKNSLAEREALEKSDPYWNSVQKTKIDRWAALELVHSGYDRVPAALKRIRMELPYEHEHGRCLEYSLWDFEKTLKERCPGDQGSVDDWCAVLAKVPRKLVEYEEFFC